MTKKVISLVTRKADKSKAMMECAIRALDYQDPQEALNETTHAIQCLLEAQRDIISIMKLSQE